MVLVDLCGLDGALNDALDGGLEYGGRLMVDLMSGFDGGLDTGFDCRFDGGFDVALDGGLVMVT